MKKDHFSKTSAKIGEIIHYLVGLGVKNRASIWVAGEIGDAKILKPVKMELAVVEERYSNTQPERRWVSINGENFRILILPGEE